MRKEHEELLYLSYPELFIEHTKSMYETAMCRGFQCGDGWYELINELCAEIQRLVLDGKMPPVIVVLVKEKEGRLRFRFRGGNNVTRLLAAEVEMRSEMICEACGKLLQDEHLRCMECLNQGFLCQRNRVGRSL